MILYALLNIYSFVVVAVYMMANSFESLANMKYKAIVLLVTLPILVFLGIDLFRVIRGVL